MIQEFNLATSKNPEKSTKISEKKVSAPTPAMGEDPNQVSSNTETELNKRNPFLNGNPFVNAETDMNNQDHLECENHSIDKVSPQNVENITDAGQNSDRSRTDPETSKCSDTVCINDDNPHRLLCAKCEKLFHYSCTKLPLYQLTYFLTKGYRTYKCVNCTVIPDYIKGLEPPNAASYKESVASQTGSNWEAFKKLRDLYNVSEEKLKSNEEVIQRLRNEKQKLKSANVQLKSEVVTHKEHIEELEKSAAEKEKLLSKQSLQDEQYNKIKEKLKIADSEIATYKANAQDLTKKEKESTAKLQSANEHFNNVMLEHSQMKSDLVRLQKERDTYKENEKELKDTMTAKQAEFDKQKDLFSGAGNSEYDSIRHLEESMTTKIAQIGKELQNTFIKQVEENNKRLEEKIQVVVNQGKTFADIAKTTTQPNGNKITNTSCLRDIMGEAKNEELNEERDKQLRLKNLIIHGVKENSGESSEADKEADESYLSGLLQTIGVKTTYKSLTRLGKEEPNKRRPLKLVLFSEDDKTQSWKIYVS